MEPGNKRKEQSGLRTTDLRVNRGGPNPRIPQADALRAFRRTVEGSLAYRAFQLLKSWHSSSTHLPAHPAMYPSPHESIHIIHLPICLFTYLPT